MYDFSKVVIVDDDPVFGQTAKGWLRDSSNSTGPIYFKSGRTFEEKFKHELGDVAVLIIDFDLNEAKTGAQIISDIRSSWNEGELIAIIAVSGADMSQLRNEFRTNGADLIFQKDHLEGESFRDNVQAMFHLAADRRVKESEWKVMQARIFQLEQKISVTSRAIKEHLFTQGDTQAAGLLRQLDRNLKG